MVENNDKIEKRYRCKVCNKTHTVELDKNICDGRAKYPFPYVILHDSVQNGEVQELLTILHIDRNCTIRAAEVQHFEGHLFTKEQVIAITNPLMEEIKMLREALAQKDAEDSKVKGNNHNHI